MTNLIISHQLGSQDPVVRVMGLFIGEGMEHHGCDVGRAHKGNLAIGAGGVDFAFGFDRLEVPAFGEVFCGMSVELLKIKQTRKYGRTWHLQASGLPMNQVGFNTQYSTPKSNKCCHTFPTCHPPGSAEPPAMSTNLLTSCFWCARSMNSFMHGAGSAAAGGARR